MTTMTVLTEADLRRLVPLDLDAITCVEEAFAALATKPVAMPPILRLDVPDHNGEVDVKTAYVPGLDGFAIKISPGFFDNPQKGLRSVNGLMVYFTAETGIVKALLLDNGYLTDVRTAAAGAVAAKHLAREDASVAAIMGAGVQARLQLKALTLVRPIREARIWALRADKAKAVAAELTQELAVPVVAIADRAEAVSGADIIVTTTPSTTPIVKTAWLVPGQHVTAMGSDAEHKNELDPEIVAKAIYVADSVDQTRRLGELHHAVAAGLVDGDAFVEIGHVIVGTEAGRRSPADLTVCDLTGTGVQDTAIARLATSRATAASTGVQFET
jgi:ectoine utilization protein EutC